MPWRRLGRWVKRIALAVAGLIVVAAILGFALDATRWRLFLIGKKLRGEVKEVSWGEMLRMIGPSSRYYLRPIVSEGRSVNSAIQNPFTSAADRDEGAKIFRARCSPCHGQDGVGDRAPPLNRPAYSHGNADWVVYRIVERGIAETGMPPSGMKEQPIWQVIAYLRSRQVETLGAAHPELAAHLQVGVSPADLIAAPSHPDDWLTYSRTLDGWRYSPLTEITADNVGKLRLRWVHQLTTNDPIVQATPLVTAGAMFVSVPPAGVVALDARTGNAIWHYSRDLPLNMSLCCGRVNRGVALLGSTVFFGTLDAHLVALDAATGTPRWETQVADAADGYSITGAPLAIGDLVIAGVSGGEFGVRGFLTAYAAGTGKQVWRFDTIPGPDEPGHDTWKADSWQTGGGPTWVTGAYDPELDLVYWGVGNPSPIYSGRDRDGDNLYTNSVIALARQTGKLAWHFQFTPHDEHDWDSNQTPILADVALSGGKRRAIGWPNRNGFYYLLDRATGEFLLGKPFVKQTWAKGLDPHGRPILAEGGRPTRKGALVYPGVAGGTNWQSASYHPGLGLIFVPATEGSSIFTSSPPEKHQPGAPFYASGANTEELEVVVKAIDLTTGDTRWEYRPPPTPGFGLTRSGLLTTAGDLVFGACAGQLFALDARTGNELWRVCLGGVTLAAPISVTVDGHQTIAIAAGRAVFLFGL
ncbi:MAG TPA: PQQ-dependent dehydrogenase, methanol/ethanol family [Kofleriaceae bacterium]